MSALRSALKKHRRIALDTSIFIYYLDAHPSYVEAAVSVFEWIERAPHSAVTSTITMTELLVHPYRSGDDSLVDRYYALLSEFPNLEWIAPSLSIADRAAQLRAVHGFRTPDALHLATALQSAATAFVTNDAALVGISGIDVLTLDSLSKL